MMKDNKRMSALADVTGEASVPGYVPTQHGCGIVHLGVGAFHRAHQAVYTDEAIAREGGNWRITGVSLRGTDVADALNPQNGLYTLIERGGGTPKARVVASVAHVLAASRDRQAPLRSLINPETRIVTLSVTEKAYGIDREANAADTEHPAVAADLQDPENPVGVLGLIVESLDRRRKSGIPPFTVLCCDNLPDNGELLRAGVIDFARRTRPETAPWIEDVVAFPSSMVDRITPAITQVTLDDARQLIGCHDLAAIETEPFSQWVIEDWFNTDRPLWEAGDALIVPNVKPFETAKLRMLNGTHSLLAYAGFLSGCTYVRDVMVNSNLNRLIDQYMLATARTLPPLAGFNIDQYRSDLMARFSNPAIAHQTYQIAMDGTEKLPQRILAPALEVLDCGGDIRPFSFATAVWMRYCLGRNEKWSTYALRDPLEDDIRARLRDASTAEAISTALHNLPGLFNTRLKTNQKWRGSVEKALHVILTCGLENAINDQNNLLSQDNEVEK